MLGQNLGKYRIIEQLGQGGMATIYRAYDPDSGSCVAVEVIRAEFSEDPQFRKHFDDQMKFSRKLNHTNILSIVDCGETDTLYQVYPLVEGSDLESYILEEGPLPLDEASHILNQIAGALDHIHRQGILHCDVKPMNIQLDRSGRAYLTDFGKSRQISDKASRLAGTPGYAAPEAYLEHNVTTASDVYSLGVTLYEMVTGRPPFTARESIVVLMKQINDPLPLPRTLRPDLPELGEQAILKALAAKPESRYQTAGAMAIAFTQAISDWEPPAAKEPSALPPRLAGGYAVAAIRQLVLEAFTPQTLRRFCQDQPTFRPIVNDFGPGHGLSDMVDRVIDYCSTALLFDELLTEIEKESPRQYKRFGPYRAWEP